MVGNDAIISIKFLSLSVAFISSLHPIEEETKRTRLVTRNRPSNKLLISMLVVFVVLVRGPNRFIQTQT